MTSRHKTQAVAVDKGIAPKKQKKMGAWQIYLQDNLSSRKEKYPDLKPHERMEKLAENFKMEKSEVAK